MTAPRSNLETRRTVSLNNSPGFRDCEKLAAKVTHNSYRRGISAAMGRHLIANQRGTCLLEKARREGRAFLEHYCLFFLFFTLTNCILQITCQIVRITLGLVELASGLQLLVEAADKAKGAIRDAAGKVTAPLTCSRSMYESYVRLMYQQRAGVSGRSIERKNAVFYQPSLERDFSFPEYPCREEFQAHSAPARLQALAAQFQVLVSCFFVTPGGQSLA